MSSLNTYHVQQMERVSSDFFEDGDGLRAVTRRTEAVDDIVRGRFEESFAGMGGVAAVAVGGYGREELFPFSDVDLLLLFGGMREAERHQERIAKLIASLWDSKLQVSHSVRTPKDCTSLAHDNTDLHISLLDARFVAGDGGFVAALRERLLPKFYLREQRFLLRSLVQKARHRHQSFEDTLYHLEPNIKEGPGGLRDYHLACWVAQLSDIKPGRLPASGECLPAGSWLDADASRRFLFSLRCYLHYYYGRDSNVLSFDLQDSIAHAAVGKLYDGPGGAADMMRAFYRNTRSVYRLALRLMDESSSPANALVSILRKRKSRLSNVDFSVSGGLIYLKEPRLLENRPERVLDLFEFQARHGLALAAETARRIHDQSAAFRAHVEAGHGPWPALKRILLLPHAYRALESMREAGVLYALFPEFALVDCLVIRDFYHRYTVDEHTLVAIRVLKDLPGASEGIDRRFASLLGEVENTELLHLALLYHDLGKGVEGRPHEQTSAEMARSGLRRIGVQDPLARETVIQLVADHLLMSEFMTKRDLSEMSVLEDFKRQVKTLERLKLLTLLTYADTVAREPLGAIELAQGTALANVPGHPFDIPARPRRPAHQREHRGGLLGTCRGPGREGAPAALPARFSGALRAHAHCGRGLPARSLGGLGRREPGAGQVRLGSGLHRGAGACAGPAVLVRRALRGHHGFRRGHRPRRGIRQQERSRAGLLSCHAGHGRRPAPVGSRPGGGTRAQAARTGRGHDRCFRPAPAADTHSVRAP